jgi:hypothetical protein
MTTTTTTAAQHPQQGHILHLRRNSRRVTIARAALALAVTLAACGSSSPGTSGATGTGGT